jgi:hypothetical protein
VRNVCLVLALFVSGCAYRFGSAERTLPGGYDLVSVPVFSNRSPETGFEVYFTNALIQQFERSKVARVVGPSQSQVTAIGKIESIILTPSATTTTNDSKLEGFLPEDSLLATGYRMVVTVSIELQRNSDRKILWTGQFQSEAAFNASQVTISGLNSVSPLYNQSAKEQNIVRIARDTMSEAHDRMTENF